MGLGPSLVTPASPGGSKVRTSATGIPPGNRLPCQLQDPKKKEAKFSEGKISARPKHPTSSKTGDCKMGCYLAKGLEKRWHKDKVSCGPPETLTSPPLSKGCPRQAFSGHGGRVRSSATAPPLPNPRGGGGPVECDWPPSLTPRGGVR